MNYTDVAWDFDGTLFDSYPHCLWAFGRMLESYGHPEDPSAVSREMLVTVRHALEVFGTKYGLDTAEMRRRYKAEEGYRPDAVKPFPQVPEVLRRIKESGRRNHLYTNRNRMAVRYLDEYGLTRYFDGLITSQDMPEMKPKPAGMYLLLERYRIAPERMLMVGDRLIDVLSARAAGADACFYNTNGLPVPEEASVVLDRTEDLARLPEFL